MIRTALYTYLNIVEQNSIPIIIYQLYLRGVTMEKIKLLVVDDSILFREVLTRYIKFDEMIEIVGKAGDAYSARDMILEHEPDVMTLDLEMPRMNGVDFLQKLLPQYYIPTIAISSSDNRKSECMQAGAVDFLRKPTSSTNSSMMVFADTLSKAVRKAYRSNHPNSKIEASAQNIQAAPTAPAAKAPAAPAAKAPATMTANSAFSAAASAAAAAKNATTATQTQTAPKPNPTPTAPSKHAKLKKTEALIALGASTGGTEALEKVIKDFPADTPPVIIVQHMPAGFTKLFSERLNRSCQMRVKEAQDGDRLERGLIIVGAGEYHLRLCKDARGWYVSSKPGEKVSGHCPSVDVMFNSVADVAGPLAIGAILTGMGRDGADGLLRMRQAGAFTVGQDKETCVVYGMPMEAYNCGAVEVQAPLQNIADIILNQLY